MPRSRRAAARGPRAGAARATGSGWTAVRLSMVAAVLIVLLTGGVAAAGASDTSTSAAVEDDRSPVVLIGMSGVRWDDVHALSTPALWELSRRGSLGALAARSVQAAACPADGWLAVSAGARLADLEAPDGSCRTLRDPAADEPVPGWSDYAAAAETQPYGATPGRLGEVVAGAGTEVTGVGPGAAIALADGNGHPVGTHLRRPASAVDLRRTVREALAASSLVVVDAGTVRDPGEATRSRAVGTTEVTSEEEPEPPAGLEEEEAPGGVELIVEPTRDEQVRAIDERVGAVLDAVRGQDATVLVLSLADSGRTALQLAAATGPAPGGDRAYAENLLTSGSTRQPGLVQATDVAPTVLAALGLEGALGAVAGAPMVPVPGPATAGARVAMMTDIAAEARAAVRVSGAYLTRLVLLEALLFAAAAVLLTRQGRQDAPGLRRGLRVLRVAALALGSAPIASFLADLLPWWNAASPRSAFWLAVGGWMAVLTAAALLGPWRRAPLGPAGLVAGATVVVLVGDALAGSPLVVDSPMGAHRIQAARFYGMSNQAFALLAAAGPLLATALAQPLLAATRRRLATLVVVAIGLVVTVVDGAPGLGSDFGGPPALILAFAVLALVVSGRRVRWRTLAVVVVLAAVVVMGFAALDWMRPPADRTHLGRFFATVLDGGLAEVVSRKLEVHLRVLTSWRYLVLAVGGALLTGLVLLGPYQRGDGTPGGGRLGARSPLAGMRDAVPLLPTCVAAIGIALGVGFLINDSGIVVPATGVAMAVPCLVAAAAQRRLSPAVTTELSDHASAARLPPGRPHEPAAR